MAKTQKLLLTTLVAIICLVALILGIMLPTASPAQAAIEYEYVNSGEEFIVVSSTPALLVTSDGYALSADGDTNLKAVAVAVEGSKVTSAVTDDMLWIVEEGFTSSDLRFKNVGQNKYLTNSGGDFSLGITGDDYWKNMAMIYSRTSYFLYINGTAVSGDSTESTSFTTYYQTEVAVVTKYQKSGIAVGETKTGILVSEYNGNSFVWGMFSATSTTCNRPFYAKLSGDTVVAVNTIAGDNQKAIDGTGGNMSMEIPSWMTWNIARTAEGITIQTNSTYSSALNNGSGKYITGTGYSSLGNTATTYKYTESGDGFILSDSSDKNTAYISSLTGISGDWQGSKKNVWTFYELQSVKLDAPLEVAFNGGADDVTGSMELAYADSGKEYVLPLNSFERTNYKFVGWSSDAFEGVKAPLEAVTLNSAATLTAVWEYNCWDVVFKMEGQADVTKSFNKDSRVSLGTNENYWKGSTLDTQKFVNWVDGKNKTYDYTDKITADDLETTGDNAGKLVLTAKMADVVKITFDGGADDAVLNYSDDKIIPGQNKTLYNGTYYIKRENYKFVGWKCSLDGKLYATPEMGSSQTYTVPNDIDLTANGTITFTAQWKIDGFTLTFKVGDEVYAVKEHGKVTSAYQFYFEKEGVAIPEAPEGKVFKQWTTSSKYNNSYSYSLSHSSSGHYASCYITLPAESSSSYSQILYYDVELTAVFEDAPIEYTFIIKYEDGTIAKQETKSSTSDKCSIYLGNSYAGTIPENKAILNWTDENDNVYTSGTNVYIYKADGEPYTKTLIVHFADLVKVSFDLNGGTTERPDYYTEKEYAAGSSQKITTYYPPTKENYTLTGWKCGDLEVQAGVPFTVANTDMTFVAQWKFNGKTLTFNNGASEYQKVELSSETTSYTIAFNDPTPEEGYTFAGWKLSTDDSATPTLYKKGDEIAAIEDGQVFEAQYKLLNVVTVTFHYGNETKTAQYTESSRSITFNIDTFQEQFTWNENMIFGGWYTDAAMTTKVPNFVTITSTTEDFDLYADVSVRVTLNFVVDRNKTVQRQGTLKDGIQVPYATGEDTDIPARENYALAGWATTDGGEIAYKAQYGVKVTTDSVTTFYAVWEYTCYDVTFTNGKTGADEVTVVIPMLKTQGTYKIENLLSKADPDNDGKTYGDRFAVEHKTLSWLYEGTSVSVDSSTENNKNKTFVAKYTDTLYTITFDVTGGSALQPISGIYGAALNLPTPVKEGYKFIGWYLNNNDKFVETTFTRDVTIIAHWVQAYTITFDANGGEPVQTLSLLEGDAITLPTPTKTGYKFVKWQKGGEDFSATTMPAENLILTAVWQMDSQLFATKLAAIDSATTLESKRAAILDADALLAIWTAAGEDTSALDTATLTAAKANYNALASSAQRDLTVAEKVAVDLVATLGVIVPLAAVALILKRRMF